MERTIPLYSQYLDVKSPEWRPRACGIVAAKMLIDFFAPEQGANISLDTLCVKGMEKGAYTPNVGWRHKGLAEIIRSFGLRSANYDWIDLSPQEAYSLLRTHTNDGPFLASVHKHFNITHGGHLVVVVSIAGKTVHYLEPASHERGTISRTVDLQTFLTGWKRRIITVSPQ
jgi:hypothetical protein